MPEYGSTLKPHSIDLERAAQPETLIDLMRWRSREHPGRVAFAHLINGEEQSGEITYGEIDRNAKAIAARLQKHFQPGERALLLYPAGTDFVSAFFGCLYAGLIAVAAPPPDVSRPDRSVTRLIGIARDSNASAVLTASPLDAAVESLLSATPYIREAERIVTDEISESADAWREPNVTSDSIAFLQYTSGSTTSPRGVMVSHGNLLSNSDKIASSWGYGHDSLSLMWVPNFHDDGLVHGTIQPIYSGFKCILMPPSSLVQKPVRWLRAISDYKATHSGGPNFAYSLCVRKITPGERKGLDLSSWRVAYNAAEPVRQVTLDEFAKAFHGCGFRKSAFYPSYGLAEATLLVSTGGGETQPPFITVDADVLEKQGLIVEPAQQTARTRTFVGCGRPVTDMRVAIINPNQLTACAPNQIGEIWLKGPSVAQGYWNQPREPGKGFHGYTAEDGEGPYLRTGDLGFFSGGELFIAGRIKDVIIIRGRNVYPQDVELTVEESHPALRRGCGAAFAIEADGEERLALVQEVDNRERLDWDEMVDRICQALALEHDIALSAAAFIRAGTILKTSSGKIQRGACREAFLAGRLPLLRSWSPTKGFDSQSAASAKLSAEGPDCECAPFKDAVKPAKDEIGEVKQPPPGKESPLRESIRKDDSQTDGRGKSTVLTNSVSSPPVAAADRFSQGPPERAVEAIEQWLTEWLKREAGVKHDVIDPRHSFASYGIDSATAVTLAADAGTLLGRTISQTMIWDYPTVGAAAAFLASESGSRPDPNREQKNSFDALDALLTKVEQLSDAEIEGALDKNGDS